MDTDCFSDVLMMHSFDDCYAFTGLVPEIVCLTSGNEDARNFSTAITDDGPTCIATSDESLVKFTYDGKKVKESILCDVDHFGIEYVANKELDEIWFIMDNDVYYLSLSEGADPVMVADQGDRLNSTLIWDPFSQRCFFIKDDMYLCSVGTEAGDVVTICDYCHLLSSEGGKNHLIGFTSSDSNYYILIGDEIVEK